MQSFTVKIKKENHDFNQRELDILKVMSTNIIAFGASRIFQKGMYINPIESEESGIILNEQFVFEEEVETAMFEQLKTNLERSCNSSFKRSKLSDIEVIIELEY